MPLFRLIYTSRTTDKLSLADFRSVIERSAARNRESGITGMLVFGNGHFLQILEGARSAVTATFLRIAKDARHTQLEILDVSEIIERRFSSWGMQLVCLSHSQKDYQQLLLKHGVTERFDPEQWTADAAQRFMQGVCEVNHRSLEHAVHGNLNSVSPAPESFCWEAITT